MVAGPCKKARPAQDCQEEKKSRYQTDSTKRVKNNRENIRDDDYDRDVIKNNRENNRMMTMIGMLGILRIIGKTVGMMTMIGMFGILRIIGKTIG